MVLQQIRMGLEGKNPKNIYRRLHGVIQLDKSEQRKGRWAQGMDTLQQEG